MPVQSYAIAFPLKAKAHVKLPAGKHAPPLEVSTATRIVPEVTLAGGQA